MSPWPERPDLLDVGIVVGFGVVAEGHALGLSVVETRRPPD